MALGNLTKQLAQQAIGNQVKEALEGKPSAPSTADSVGATILGQLQAMQKALKEDEELVVWFNQTIRIVEVFMPSWHVAVLTGIDSDKSLTRIISPVESLQLICKPAKVHPPAKPTRINLHPPKA